MSEQQSKRKEAEGISHVDGLLNRLSDLSQREPSPALRGRLVALAASRLEEHSGNAARPRGGDRRKPAWLKAAFASGFLAGVGLLAVTANLFWQAGPRRTHGSARVNHPSVSPGFRVPTAPAQGHRPLKRSRVRPMESASLPLSGARQMTMRLPYSNSAIETGTDTTIRVSMSQSELLSLGFPINATIPDRRIVAELTLGDDGLPRAISVPLPIEEMKGEQ